METGAVYVNINYSYGNASGMIWLRWDIGRKKWRNEDSDNFNLG